jgi:hypothetical protein
MTKPTAHRKQPGSWQSHASNLAICRLLNFHNGRAPIEINSLSSGAPNDSNVATGDFQAIPWLKHESSGAFAVGVEPLVVRLQVQDANAA